FLSLMTPRTPRPTLFPYTTLFRSEKAFAPVRTNRTQQILDRMKQFPTNSASPPTEMRATMEQAVEQNKVTFEFLEEAIKLTSCRDRKSTRLNSSHVAISYAVFCLK